MIYFFFFKQKTAYEMRISDWSSDVCSSDLQVVADGAGELQELVRDDDADGMHAAIRRIGFAAAVAGPAGQRIEGTGLQLSAKHVLLAAHRHCSNTQAS